VKSRPCRWLVVALVSPALGAEDWGQFARGPGRVAASDGAAPLLAARWVRSVDEHGSPITFAGQSGVVVDAPHAYALGRVGGGGQQKLFALRRTDGGVAWSAPVPLTLLDSWSTPAVDTANGSVIAATGRFVTAVRIADGGQLWQTQLDRTIVNASPLITESRGPADRIFITDYDGFGGSAKLYCLNADAFHPTLNPYQPGQIVWSAPIGGGSGNTPAYAAGVVFVSTVSDQSGLGTGRVMAFDAGATSPPPPLWVFENPAGTGFFGGVCVADGSVFAATYAFSGGVSSAELIKLNAATGAMAWTVPCNRTNSTPVPLPNGRIVLSGGVAGFGSAPSVALFRDDGASAIRLWDSALATWNDLNSNSTMDPGEYLAIGGWTHQPAAAAIGSRLVVGAMPSGGFGACTDLYTIDLALDPSDPAFIAAHAVGMGSTPALSHGGVYTIGPGGLYALGSPPPPLCYANCDASTTAPILNVQDFSCFLNAFAAGEPYANCDNSTTPPALNVQDFSCFLNAFAAGCP
jgi:outer membrane protein assembly factor BamB